jgi:hypothetical protein
MANGVPYTIAAQVRLVRGMAFRIEAPAECSRHGEDRGSSAGFARGIPTAPPGIR